MLTKGSQLISHFPRFNLPVLNYTVCTAPNLEQVHSKAILWNNSELMVDTKRFTKPHLTSTSGRATLTQISTCLTLLSSFQSGRYMIHCIISQGQIDTGSNSGQVPSLSAEETYSPERIEGWEKIDFKLLMILCCSHVQIQSNHKHNYKWFHSKIPELFAGTEKARSRPAGVDSSRPSLARSIFLSLIIW